MKTVYFVRHGQSEGNVGSVYQTAESPLTEQGRKQAGIIAGRCAKLPIDVIISSNQLRAKTTAEIIASKTDHQLELSAFFRERKKPTSLNGKSFNDPVAVELNGKWWQSLMGDGSRAEDGENFDDLKVRALKGLEYLIQRQEENILVVTHGFYMRYIVACAVFGENLTGEKFEPLARSLIMENTGITVLRHGTVSNPAAWGVAAKWELWMWNDHAHLG